MDNATHEEMSKHRLAVLPDLDADVYAGLVASIRREGLQDAIWLYEGAILDGWHRYRACREDGIEPRYREYEGEHPAHFVLSKQRDRRNWTPSQAAAAAAVLEADLAKEAAERAEEGRRKGRETIENRRKSSRQIVDDTSAASDSHGKGDGSNVANMRDHQRESSGRSATRAAAAVGGTNRQYVSQYKRIELRDTDLAAQIRSGNATISQAARLLRERDAAERHRAEREANQHADRYEPELHLADFREVTLEPESVDAIITDPPYPRKYLGLYGDLAEYAARVLRPGGLLLAMAGQMYLPDVIRQMEEHAGESLSYLWFLSVDFAKPSGPVHPRRVLPGFKPILVYSKGKYEGSYFYDRLPSSQPDKSLHEWAQSEMTFDSLIERFTKTGDAVLDPMVGAGTTGVAALDAKRKFIGIESDPEAFETARRRMAGAGSGEVELPAA